MRYIFLRGVFVIKRTEHQHWVRVDCLLRFNLLSENLLWYTHMFNNKFMDKLPVEVVERMTQMALQTAPRINLATTYAGPFNSVMEALVAVRTPVAPDEVSNEDPKQPASPSQLEKGGNDQTMRILEIIVPVRGHDKRYEAVILWPKVLRENEEFKVLVVHRGLSGVWFALCPLAAVLPTRCHGDAARQMLQSLPKDADVEVSISCCAPAITECRNKAMWQQLKQFTGLDIQPHQMVRYENYRQLPMSLAHETLELLGAELTHLQAVEPTHHMLSSQVNQALATRSGFTYVMTERSVSIEAPQGEEAPTAEDFKHPISEADIHAFELTDLPHLGSGPEQNRTAGDQRNAPVKAKESAPFSLIFRDREKRKDNGPRHDNGQRNDRFRGKKHQNSRR